MKHPLSFAIFLVAACALSTGAWGQKVYRCGDTYSQTPCPGAVAVDAEDARSSQQKSQADKAITRDKATAETMEKARLKEEAQATEPSATPLKKDKRHATASKSKPKKAPEYFTAKAAVDKKKSKTPSESH